MGLFDFIKGAGKKVIPDAQAQPAAPTHAGSAQATAGNAAQAAPRPDVAALNEKAGTAILEHIRQQGLASDALRVSFDGASSTVTVSGEVPDQATREKIVLLCGNVSSVERVDDRMTVAAPAEQASFYTVKSGDTLSKIAKQMYGDANRYPEIFEANKPMLKDPDEIYPGQTLRIPSATA